MDTVEYAVTHSVSDVAPKISRFNYPTEINRCLRQIINRLTS